MCINRKERMKNHNNQTGDFPCEVCNKMFHKKASLYSHLSHHKPREYNAWNKGLTKETNEIVRKCGETYSKNYKEGKFSVWAKGKTKETDERLQKLSESVSRAVKEKVKNDEWHYSFSKKRIVVYKGIKLHGTWEYAYAKYMDDNGIEWTRPKDNFTYLFKGKEHSYTPDFYIPKEDLWIEIKGYETAKDKAKWKCFTKTLKIITGKDLVELGLLKSEKSTIEITE